MGILNTIEIRLHLGCDSMTDLLGNMAYRFVEKSLPLESMETLTPTWLDMNTDLTSTQLPMDSQQPSSALLAHSRFRLRYPI